MKNTTELLRKIVLVFLLWLTITGCIAANDVVVPLVMQVESPLSTLSMIAQFQSPLPPAPKVTQFQSPLTFLPDIVYVRLKFPQVLLLFNTRPWQIVKQVMLPDGWADIMEIDPLGRIWISYAVIYGSDASGQALNDNRLSIFAPDGARLRTLSLCGASARDVYFNGGKAFIICHENDFDAQIVVLNLTNFEVENRILLELPDGSDHLYERGNNIGDRFIFGLIPKQNLQSDTRYQAVTLLDLDSEETVKFTLPDVGIKIYDGAYYQGQYYFFNAASWQSTREYPTDIIIAKENEFSVTTKIAAPAPSPVFGVLKASFLYMYHNPTMGGAPKSSFTRTLSRLNLETGEGKTWELPDNWNVQDMETIDGKIVLAYPGDFDVFTTLREPGLYEFDPENGQLHLLLPLTLSRMKIRLSK